MMKKPLLYIIIGAAILLLAIALVLLLGNDEFADLEGSPYEIYQNAYQRLKESDSFSSHYFEEVQNIYDNPEDNYTYSVDLITSYIYNNGDYQAICEETYTNLDSDDLFTDKLSVYCIDGYSYEINSLYCRAWDTDDAPLQIALATFRDFTEDVLARQKSKKTAEGLLLSFVLDGQKYTQVNYEEYELEYDDENSYVGNPLFTALIDKEGNLKQITGEFITQTEGMQEIRSFTAEYYDINKVAELDFSGLNKADYKEINN